MRFFTKMRKFVPYKRKKAHRNQVWWDVENCSVPQGYDATQIRRRIKLAMRGHGNQGLISIRMIAVNRDRFPHRVQRQLRQSGGTSMTFVRRGTILILEIRPGNLNRTELTKSMFK